MNWVVIGVVIVIVAVVIVVVLVFPKFNTVRASICGPRSLTDHFSSILLQKIVSTSTSQLFSSRSI